jgi:hypothetical protein
MVQTTTNCAREGWAFELGLRSQERVPKMKTQMAGMVALIFLLSAYERTSAQSTNVDFVALNLNIGLTAMTNGTPVTNDDNTVTADSGQLKINSAGIVQMLSGRRSFPLGKIIDGNGNAIPHLGAAAMTNFPNNAKLLLLEALGTNHGSVFVVIRDAKHRVDYDVSEYFTFSTRGFSGTLENHIDSHAKLDLNTGEQMGTRIYVGEFSFDDSPSASDASDRVAFNVDGLTTEQRSSVSSHGDLIDTDATRSLNANNVVGTGIVSNSFAVFKGFISATGARHETK